MSETKFLYNSFSRSPKVIYNIQCSHCVHTVCHIMFIDPFLLYLYMILGGVGAIMCGLAWADWYYRVWAD